jgi:hypothetical protein
MPAKLALTQPSSIDRANGRWGFFVFRDNGKITLPLNSALNPTIIATLMVKNLLWILVTFASVR